jgi:hypothetical protein
MIPGDIISPLDVSMPPTDGTTALFHLNGHYFSAATPFHRRLRGPAEASPARDGSRLNPAGTKGTAVPSKT